MRAKRFPGDLGGPIGLGGPGKASEAGTHGGLWPLREWSVEELRAASRLGVAADNELWHRTRPLQAKLRAISEKLRAH